MAAVWNVAAQSFHNECGGRGQQYQGRLQALQTTDQTSPNTQTIPIQRIESYLRPFQITKAPQVSISKAQAPVQNEVAKKSGNKKKPHTKSRGGCTTCKRHRVKCDQVRPVCLRCERLFRLCGYNERKNTVNHRSLQPKGAFAVRRVVEPTQQLFSSNQEYQYFTLFSEKTVAKLSPYFSTLKWKEMILQTCASEQTIRDVCIAISALDLTLVNRSCNNGFVEQQISSKHRPPLSPKNSQHRLLARNFQDQSSSTPHHWFALRQYDKAIRRMRDDVSTGKQTIRTTLVACIMMSYFEVMYGSHQAAIAQLQSGITLYQDWKNCQLNASSHTTGFSSPAPNVVDDFMSQTFGRLELQTMSFTDKRSAKCHQKLLLEGSRTIQQMPAKFTTLEEARIYVDLIMRRLLHYARSISIEVPHTTPSLPPNPKTTSTCNDNTNPSGFNDAVTGFGSALQQLHVNKISLTAEGAQLTTDLNRWSKTFDPILAQQRLPSAEPMEKIAAFTMKIAALASEICTSKELIGDETRYDSFMDQFEQIVDYTTELLYTQGQMWCGEKEEEVKNTELLICFEIGVIPPLSIVVIKCRDARLRRKGLKLLEKYPRKEGVWDSTMTADLSRWAMSIEEGWEGREDPWTEDSEPTFIPEYKRVNNVGLQYDLETGNVAMGCLAWDSTNGEWLTRKTVYAREAWGL